MGEFGGHHDVVRRGLWIRSLRDCHDLDRVTGRLGEDGRRLGHVAEVDGPSGLRRDDGRPADEVAPVDRVGRTLEGVGGREDRLVLLQLVAEVEGHAGSARRPWWRRTRPLALEAEHEPDREHECRQAAQRRGRSSGRGGQERHGIVLSWSRAVRRRAEGGRGRPGGGVRRSRRACRPGWSRAG